jgi:hypothetical protein
MHRKIAGLIVLLFAVSTPVLAQKNDVSFSIGAVATSSQTTIFVGLFCTIGNPNCGGPFNTSTSAGVAFEGAYARQVFNLGGAASLGVELPLVGVPGRDLNVKLLGVPLTTFSQSSLFFTPSARIKFLPSSPVSPFFSLGGGLAHHGGGVNQGIFQFGSGAGSAINRGALQFGGGVDFKTPLPHIGLRVEVRDFWARGFDESTGNTQVSPERQHNIFAGGGIVFRF